ncbi:MAG: DUF5103 domain-containing protein [Bacteroidales bacterium]
MIKQKYKSALLLLFLLLYSGITSALPAQVYHTKALDKSIRSLQITVNDDWRNPSVLRLGKGDRLSVEFDMLTDEYPMLYYTIHHCDVNWKESGLSSTEYMTGFNKIDIEDYTQSFNTLTNYVHYRISLPDENYSLKLSGNYVMKIYSYDHPGAVLALACFSLTEDKVQVAGEVSGITLKDYKKSNQQLKVKVITDDLQVRNPQSELKLVVQQNSRTDNQRILMNPLYMNNKEIVYENTPQLTFPGGNQFRRFEMTTHKYSGMGIESVSFHHPYYNVELQADQVRANRPYRYDQDQYGKYIIRALDVADSNTEADYFLTHFFLDMDDPLINGRIYVFGELSNFLADERFEMSYDATLRGYTHSHLLKEGLYNFIYLYVPNGSDIGETGLIEGNFYETHNEYLIRVYYRSAGDRYDRLVGTRMIY